MARRVTCPTFVGREDELGRLEAAAAAALDASQVVLLGGDAGVGKTRLVDEAAKRVRARGAAAAVGGCVDLGERGSGYAPLLEVLRSLRNDVGAQELDAIVADAAPALVPLLGSGVELHDVRQEAVEAHTLALLEALGERVPGTTIIFEDLQWAGASIRDLVSYLAGNLSTAKVVVVLTYRTDDLHRRHPLRPLLAELIRRPGVEHLLLGGMSRSELTVLAAGVIDAVPADDDIDELLRRSDGNPFFAEELLAAPDDSGGLPTSVRELVLARVARLPDEVQAVLRDAAALSSVIDERVLAAMTGRSAHEVADALRTAVAQQLLVAVPAGCCFRHALVREALYSEILPGERQRLHAAAAAVIVRHPELVAEPDHLRWASLAHHWGAAEDQPNAFAASVRAAVEAERVGALADAVAHYDRALELWSRVPDPEAASGMGQVDLLLRAADATTHAGAPARAVGMATAALDLLGPDAEPERRATVLERLGNHRWVACDPSGSESARLESVALLADRPPTEAKAIGLSALGRHHLIVDRFAEAEGPLREALDVAAAVGSDAARSGALSGLGFVVAKLGRTAEGVELGRQALALAERSGIADDIGRAYVNLVATLVAATRCEEAAEVAVVGIEHARRTGMLASDGVLLAYNGADALFWLGRWDEAIALLEVNPMHRDRAYGTSGAMLLARIALLRGQYDLAALHCDLALSTADATAAPPPAALAVSAQLAARDGRFDDARRDAAGALAIVEASDDLFLAATMAAVAIELEADRVEASRVRGVSGQADAGSARAVADDVLAWSVRAEQRLRDRGEPGADATAQLAMVEAEHDRAWGRSEPERWAAVAAGWEELRFLHPAAVARYREAEATLRTRGGRAGASEAARRALAAAERLGATPLAEQVRNLAQRGRLDLVEPEPDAPAPPDPFAAFGVSTREREVLELVAAGRTNRQIAEELYISEKTASVHVTHLLRKLGVASRIEAAALAQQLTGSTS